MKSLRPHGLWPLLCILLPLLCLTPATAASPPVLVFAAASLKNALDDVAALWQQQSGHAAAMTYAASNALASQIEHGAPADLYFSADLDWMRYLSERGLTRRDSERALLGNQLVLIAPRDSTVQAKLVAGVDLLSVLQGGRLAICAPSVPAGKYATAALQQLGAWEALREHTAWADNVRAALAFVARGEAPLGVVYRSDAHAEPAVRVVDTFPEQSHPPIRYVIALTTAGSHPDASSLLSFIESDAAKPLFERQGFTVLAANGADAHR